MRVPWVIIIGLVVTTLGGCAARPTSGVVGWRTGFGVGAFAPDIPFTSASGEKATLHGIRMPIALVAFVDTGGETCCWLDPRLVRMAERLWENSVTVVQVSLPSAACRHGPGCIEACRLGNARMVSLCDAGRRAWKAYGQPAPSTVLLIDREGRVVAMGTTEHLDPVAARAHQMAEELEHPTGLDG